MQIPILSGIVTDENAEFRQAYPVNLIPVPKETGISNGYLRPADGIVQLGGTTPGIDRGSVSWRQRHYRVLGSRFCEVLADDSLVDIGTVAGSSGQTRFAIGFDRLAVTAGGAGYYYDGTTLTQISDPDLGTVHDVIFTAGYFLFIDPNNIVQTDLAAPTSIDTLNYGSAELNPDALHSIHLRRDEPIVVGRYSIEVFRNVGGTGGFAFQRIEGAQVDRGSLGRTCACEMGTEWLAFLGSAEKESPSIWVAANATSERIATREIDKILKLYTEDQLSVALLETRFDQGHEHLYVHLPDRTLLYDMAASAAAGEPVWSVLTTDLISFGQYRARNFVWVHDRWACGDPIAPRLGYLTQEVSTHYAAHVRWEFSTVILYNDGLSGIVHELELVALTGRTAFGLDPFIATAYSKDGLSWSQERSIKVGARGQRDKRLVWRSLGVIGHFRVQRFRADSQSFASFVRLEAQIEPLEHATA